MIIMKKNFFVLFFLFTIKLFSQIDALHYNIYIDSIDFDDQLIFCKTTITLDVGINEISEISFDLLSLEIDSVKCENTLCLYNYNDSTLNISGLFVDTVDITIFYHGHPTLDIGGWGGFYFSGDYAFNMGIGIDNIPHNMGRSWFPCIDNFTDKATYDYYITTEISKKAVCGGILIDSTFINLSTIQWHWHNPHPIPAYLASVSVGHYVVWKDTVQGINNIVPIEIYVPNSSLAKVPGSFQNLKSIFHIFEKYYGPYKWSRIGFVGVPFSGGAMEHAMNIAYPIACINGNLAYESLYAHELSHHWFGNLATCESAEEMWINEGWARFSEILYKEKLYGKEEANLLIKNLLSDVLKKAHKVDGGFYPLCDIPQNITYGTTVYDKGALIVNTLRNYLGDSLFFGATKYFLEQFAWSNASCIDIQESFEQYTNIVLNDFFQNYLYHSGTPHYRIDSFNVSHNNEINFIQLYTSQHRYGGDYLTEHDSIEVWLWGANKEMDSLKINTGLQNYFIGFHHAIAPIDVWIDPKQKTADAIINGYAFLKSISNHSIPNTNVIITPTYLEDSLLVFVEHHFIGPHQILKNHPIHRISPNHYWTIHLPYLDNNKVNLKISYNRSYPINIDPSDFYLLPTAASVDSLVLVYRKNSTEPWQIVNFTKTGNQVAGYLTTVNAKAGDYAFAISEPGQSNINDFDNTNYLQIYPNPTNDEFKIIVPTSGFIQIYSMIGDLIFEELIETEITYKILDKGTFLVRFIPCNNTKTFQKLLFVY